MGITSARAWANNEVAIATWSLDERIEGCLGFEVTRVYVDENDEPMLRDDGTEDRAVCAAWVPFKGQSNPRWIPQDTSVWPVQKLSWRDLTLRKRRTDLGRRPDEVRVRYEIRPVGDLVASGEAVPPNGREHVSAPKLDKKRRPVLDGNGDPVMEVVRAYEGAERPLGYLGEAVVTNTVLVTSRLGKFRSTFTNGILAAQWLRKVLLEDGKIEPNELIEKIENPQDPHRKYLAGDVIPLIKEVLERPGELYLALYELEDRELEDVLVANADRLHVILSNTGVDDGGKWDKRNHDARKRLIDAGVDIQHRMFNNNTHIGHNKFVVQCSQNGTPKSVLTGSTNWTSTGLAGQTNNAILIEDKEVAGVFLEYWKRLHDDALKVPKPFSKAMKDNEPGADLRTANATPERVTLSSGARVDIWFSPNRPERSKPSRGNKPTPVPPDLAEVYRLMRRAEAAIVFIAFYPGQAGKDCIIGEAIDVGLKDPSLLVAGVVSSPQAMPNYRAKKKEDGEVVDEGESPATYDDGNVSIVRASRIDDRSLLGDFGAEQLTAKGTIGAITHDKVVVIDPMSETNCAVIFGSHNLGFKASYSNDENMIIVHGDQALAMAYAVHALDVYDHYRFRAVQAECARKKKPGWSGFLSTKDSWQDDYVDGTKGRLMRYFVG